MGEPSCPTRRRPGRWGAVAAAGAAAVLAAAPVAVASFAEGATAQATLATDTLQPPSGLTAGVCLLGSVTLSWTATPSTWADGYEVRWSTTSGGPYTAGSKTSATTSTVVSGLSLLTTYYFVVRAYDGNWRSANSNQVTVSCV
ncbi:MAG TPA: fibronectin type III domain-containing protein [Acidimicrobiales bacterium]|nr:fibronectin type III domain-containing protein [Acidimicrobiales bacterium]